MKTAPISVTLINSCGDDLTCVNAARVSFHKESSLMSTKDESLINYLAKHEHKSPFNHCFLSFRVKAPIFVARQLVKHRFMPFNEVSRRYVDEEPEVYIPEKLRKRAMDKKQGSSNEEITGVWDSDYVWYSQEFMERAAANAVFDYECLIKAGTCPEQARMVLPQNTMTTWIWSGTLGAFCDMLRLRLKSDTQEETRQVATLIAKDVARLFPVSYNALLGTLGEPYEQV